jgi:hypothetical protein
MPMRPAFKRISDTQSSHGSHRARAPRIPDIGVQTDVQNQEAENGASVGLVFLSGPPFWGKRSHFYSIAILAISEKSNMVPFIKPKSWVKRLFS